MIDVDESNASDAGVKLSPEDADVLQAVRSHSLCNIDNKFLKQALNCLEL